jgi:preprotein translocase subunit SecA
MEFVKWKDQLEPWIENKEFEFFDSNNKKCISVEYIQYTRHYLVMSTKTAEQKIQYFLDNALLP